jgi:hypothetical protein
MESDFAKGVALEMNALEESSRALLERMKTVVEGARLHRKQYAHEVGSLQGQLTRLERLLLGAVPIHDREDRVCGICMERPKSAAFARCGHTACVQCASDCFEKNSMCPFCSAQVDYVMSLYL